MQDMVVIIGLETCLGKTIKISIGEVYFKTMKSWISTNFVSNNSNTNMCIHNIDTKTTVPKIVTFL